MILDRAPRRRVCRWQVTAIVFWLMVVGVAHAAAGLKAASAEARRPPNVLFIAVDDLRPELGCYGVDQVRSPNIDRLASRGVTFTRAYCQWAICGVSRASLLTGLRPDTIKGAGMGTHFRKYVPDVITLPQHFKNAGYHAQALGKIYHGAFANAYVGRRMHDPPSWSVKTWLGSPRYYFTPTGEQVARQVFTRTQGRGRIDADQWVNHFVRGLATEAPEVEDNVPYDGRMTEQAIETLGQIKDRPFFLAVGYLKPHLPFVAPRKYWDLYDPDAIPLPRHDQPPAKVPGIALNNWGELRYYHDMPKKGGLSAEQTRHLRHGYYACVSYIDAQIGRLLAELDRLKLRDNTIVVLWGDHGWKLGDYGMWCKHTNFELDTRVPLIVSVPGREGNGRRSSGLVELLDLYPTLTELAGLELPDHLEGASFAPLLDRPDGRGKPRAFSQYPRQVAGKPAMGYSMRTDRYRLTVWKTLGRAGKVHAVELYDHMTDPQESVNVSGDPKRRELLEKLRAQLDRHGSRWGGGRAEAGPSVRSGLASAVSGPSGASPPARPTR